MTNFIYIIFILFSCKNANILYSMGQSKDTANLSLMKLLHEKTSNSFGETRKKLMTGLKLNDFPNNVNGKLPYYNNNHIKFEKNYNTNPSEDRLEPLTKRPHCFNVLHASERSLPKNVYIKIATFYDQQFHENNDRKDVLHIYEDYIKHSFTVIKGVEILFNNLYNDVGFKFVLTDVKILTEKSIEFPKNKYGSTYLKKFAHWQSENNSKGDFGNSKHWDFSVLFTGNKFKGESLIHQPAGLSYCGKMCFLNESVSLIKDEGLMVVYTLAHELAHAFGIPHDGEDSLTSECPSQMFLMSPTLEPGKVTWSNCSKKFMTNFLKSSQADCVLDYAKENEQFNVYKNKLPGEIYSADEQCKFSAGKGYTVLNHNEICHEMYCKNPNIPLAERAHNALDGSECAEGKWCRLGKCVLRDNFQQSRVNWIHEFLKKYDFNDLK